MAEKETTLLRINTEAHAKLSEIAEANKRSLGNQAEMLIDAAYTQMQHPEMAEVGTILIIGNPEHTNSELLQALTRERKVIVQQFSDRLTSARPTPSNRPSPAIIGG